MSEISPRPWNVDVEHGHIKNEKTTILIADVFIEKDLVYLVNCVNEHDKLVEENEQLIESNFQYNLQYSKDANMIHRLGNALRQCTPGLIFCNFCEGTSMEGHKPNCEYIKLIGGEKNA